MRVGRKRELVADTCTEWNASIRRAWQVLEFDTSTYHYKTRRRDQAGIEARIKDICATRVRYGTPEGWEINVKRTYRILQALRTSTAEQDAEKAREGEATRRPPAGRRAQR